jgi:predicted PilT family ATPase
MNIPADLKDLINEYVKQIESKEKEMLFLKAQINDVSKQAERQMELKMKELENLFNLNKISEEEYLKLLREEKNKILNEMKDKLNLLLANLERKQTADLEKLEEKEN